MKKLNLYFTLILLTGVFLFSSCEKEDDKKDKEVTITFEEVTLNTEGFQNNFPAGLILSNVNFYNSFTDRGGGSTSWDGFAVSKKTDRETAGYKNDMSVYGTGGANGSEKFGVAYAAFELNVTHCRFLEDQEFVIKSLMINNTTYTALEVKNGGYGKKFEAGDWFKVIITGLAANGTEKGKVEFYLADFRDGKTYICQDWTKVDLSSLGKVNKLEFTFDSTDKDPVYGVNTPQYACIDDIVYILN